MLNNFEDVSRNLEAKLLNRIKNTWIWINW